MNVNSAFHMLAVLALDSVGLGLLDSVGEDLPFKLSQHELQNNKPGATSKPGCQC